MSVPLLTGVKGSGGEQRRHPKQSRSACRQLRGVECRAETGGDVTFYQPIKGLFHGRSECNGLEFMMYFEVSVALG